MFFSIKTIDCSSDFRLKGTALHFGQVEGQTAVHDIQQGTPSEASS